MASTTKKSPKNNKPKLRRPKLKTSVAAQAQAIVELRQQLAGALEREKAALKKLQDRDQQLAESAKELQDCKGQLTEALEQQTASSDVLRVIASSPTELQPVLDTVVANAVRLAGAKKGHILLYDGEFLRLAAHCNESPEEVAIQRDMPVRLVPESLNGRAFLERKPVQRLDAQTEPNYEGPGRKAGARTALAVPMLREGSPIGTLLIWREFVQSFSERQVDLVKTFADQAVIAIENARLINEQQTHNRELAEALEQQTATSEILGAIASSPTDIQPVLDIVAQNAARLCAASDASIWRTDGDKYWLVASHGSLPVPESEERRPITRSRPSGRAMFDKETVHVHDILSTDSVTEFPEAVRIGSVRTVLATPLLRERLVIGAIHIRRTEVRPFTEKQIALLKTFADQAVIAIENVRLFQELQVRNRDLTEALDQQTATSKILEVIASSPTELQPVMDAIAESAARLCGADDALIFRLEGDSLKRFANFGSLPGELGGGPRGIDQNSIPGRAVISREMLHIHDLAAIPEAELPALFARRLGVRTALATPLLREGTPIGVIMIRRTEVQPFTEKQIALLKTFADQAVIAIENVRLFQELQERNRDLTEALEQQTATSEVLRVIASSPTQLQPVLDTLIANAVKLSGATRGHVRQFDGEFYRVV
ncbi:MAG TPA: GAF domain-containing protein, partial [Pyrinomonadaceae bacterium]|nr:GAF domain-containing protein [Pyrinomonadaceae bacterium]